MPSQARLDAPGALHLLFKSGKYGISVVMRKLLTWYAQFQNRHKSILCEEESYLLALDPVLNVNKQV